MTAARMCAAMLVAALLSASGCAARRPRPAVAVLEVRGAGGEAWQRRVAELAESRRYEIIPARTYWVMATRLNAEPLTAANVAKVASTVGATAVVHGRVSGVKRRRAVTIYVRAGDTGRVVEKHRVRLRGSRRARGEAALERRLLASLPDPDPAAPEEPRPRPGPEGKTKATARSEPAARSKPVARSKPARSPAEARRSAAAKSKPDAPRPAPVEYDDRGQAIDHEMPSTLR